MKKLFEIIIYIIIIALTLNYEIHDWKSQSWIISSLNDNKTAIQDLSINLEREIVGVISDWKENKLANEFYLESNKLLPHNILKIPANEYSYAEISEKLVNRLKKYLKYISSFIFLHQYI